MRRGSATLLTWAAAVCVAACLASWAADTPHARAAVLPGAWMEVGNSIDGAQVSDPNGLAGRVSAIAALPGSPPTEVVGTLGGIWEQTGTGAWHDVTSPRWPATAVNSLAVDPSNPSVLYAGTGYDDVDDSSAQPGEGILKSTDGGANWSPLTASEPLMRGYAVTGLAVDPMNSQIVVAAANNGLFRSTNAGTTWTKVLTIHPGPYLVAEVRLAADPMTGDMLIGVAQSNGVVASHGRGTITTGHAIYRSTDGGQTWHAFALDSGTGGGLVVVPALASSAGQTYAYALDITGGSATGLYTSSDDGQSWQLMTTQVATKASISQMVVDPQNPTNAYFAQGLGPFEYTWGASTVQTISGANGSMSKFGDWRALAFGPAADGGEALYGGTDGGTCSYDFTSNDFLNNNAGLVSGIDYAGNAASPTLELSGAQDLGVDALAGSKANEIYHADGYGVLIDQRHPSTYYAGVNREGGVAGFVVSHNSGRTWSSLSLPSTGNSPYYMGLVQAAGDPNLVILPEDTNTMFVSSDDGATWQQRTIAGLGSDYLRTVSAALVRGSSTPVIYAGTGFGNVWESTDLGATWTMLNVAVPSSLLSVFSIVIDTADSVAPGSEHLFVGAGAYAPQAYAGTSTEGAVLESTDSGATWQNITGSLSGTSVNSLLLSGSTLLAGTDNGVEQYVGGSWSPAGTGFPNVRVTDLFLSTDREAFFATTYGRGTLESIIPASPSVIKAALRRVLGPTGRAATITSLMANGGYTFTFTAPATGKLTITWYLRPKARHRVPLAHGTAHVTGAGITGPVRVTLTQAGAQLFQRSHSHSLKLVTVATFMPAIGPTVTLRKNFALRAH
jgi:hypothetical protein